MSTASTTGLHYSTLYCFVRLAGNHASFNTDTMNPTNTIENKKASTSWPIRNKFSDLIIRTENFNSSICHANYNIKIVRGNVSIQFLSKSVHGFESREFRRPHGFSKIASKKFGVRQAVDSILNKGRIF